MVRRYNAPVGYSDSSYLDFFRRQWRRQVLRQENAMRKRGLVDLWAFRSRTGSSINNPKFIPGPALQNPMSCLSVSET